MASQSSQMPPAGVPPDEISRSSSALSMQHLKRPKLLHQSTRSSFLSLSGDQVLDSQDPLLTLKSMTRRGAILGLFDAPTGPDVTTCCAIRTAEGTYAFAPSEPCEELSNAIERIGENAVMSMASEVTSLVLAALRPGQRSLVVENTGTRIPILASFEDIQQSIVQSSGSCIITAAQCVLVWSNEPKAIINVAHSIERQMLSCVAEHEITESMDSDSAKCTQQPVRGAINEKDAVYRRAIEVEEGLDGTEADLSGKLSPRPVLRIHSLRIGCVMILVIFAQSQGVSRLIRQWSWDGNYTRFVLAVFNPPLAVLSLFFFLVVIGSIFQFIVPSGPCRKNSKYHSAVMPNPQRHRDYELPHITIQMPVYKEGLRGVIVPTMVSVMAAIERYEQQGGTASVFVNDDGMQCIQPDLAAARKQYYRENGIGYCARLPNMKVQKRAGCLSWFKKSPPVNSEVDNQDESELSPQGRANKLKFVRKGKFKKASNMNYCLTFSNRVEDEMMRLMELECQQRNCHESELTAEDDDKLYDVALENMLAADEDRTWAEGNIRMGELILIIDCDTRVPLDCLLYGALEMHESPEVAILQHGSGVMQVAHNVFENAITFFTNIVYTAIKYSVGTGDVGPFVGHNAFLRWRAVQSVAFVDPIDGQTKYWSDAHVSEDFDISLRIQIAGMICRLATYHDGGFQEGVSLTIYDELNRWEKYSYGCSELVFHPLYQWIYKGPVTRLFLRFLWSNIPVSSKVSITAYIFTYYAIAMGMVMTLANYFLVGLFANDLDHFYMPSWGIWVSLLVVFNGTASVALSLTRHRLKEEPFWHVIVESVKWLPFMILFFGGLGIHCGKALLCHILSINLEWASTSKELGPTGIYIGLNKMLHRFKYTFIFCIAVAAGMIYMATAAPWGWRIDSGAFSGGTLAIAPLAMQISCTFALPIFLGLT